MATRRHFLLNHFTRDELYSNVSHLGIHNLHQHSKRSFDSSTNVPANQITQGGYDTGAIKSLEM